MRVLPVAAHPEPALSELRESNVSLHSVVSSLGRDDSLICHSERGPALSVLRNAVAVTYVGRFLVGAECRAESRNL